MSKVSKPDTRAQLLRGNFAPAGPQSSTLSDPIEPTPMVLTLEQLRPYELNPRQKQNPKYEEIKESIRARGLDDAPTVSRRPGETQFVIDNGGNTRLKILNELWKETRDEQFFRIHCLFRPWVGDIKALTGHMAENDMRGSLMWIERCMGVRKTRELYEQDEAGPISQAELARRLKADGYPVNRTHINKMEQTIQFLSPCIPNILWAGMGVDSAQKLLSLRTHAENAWNKLLKDKGSPPSGVMFEQIFANALLHFDEEPDSYVFQHVQDELVGLMTQELRPNGVSYELIMLEIDCARTPQGDLSTANITATATPPPSAELPPVATSITVTQQTQPTADGKLSVSLTHGSIASTASLQENNETSPNVSGSLPSQRIEPDYQNIESLPVTVDGANMIGDIWMVYPQYQSPEVLRHQIELLAAEISGWAGILDHQRTTQTTQTGVGYRLERPELFESETAEIIWHVLASLTGEHQEEIHMNLLEAAVIHLLPDDLLIKLFRLIRLIRVLKDLIAG